MAKVNKSAKDGKFVSDEEAKANPDTTYETEVNTGSDTPAEVPTVKHFRIVDEDNVIIDIREFNSKSEARRYMETSGVKGKIQEFKPYEHPETEDTTDSEAAQRTTTFDQETVTLAREFGVNPDNFDNEQDLETAVEARREEVAAAKKAEEDRELKLQNERSEDEKAE